MSSICRCALVRQIQLKDQISLRAAVERVMALKAIRESGLKGTLFKRKVKGGGNENKFNNNGEKLDYSRDRFSNFRERTKPAGSRGNECWLCGKEKHFRSECPSQISKRRGNSG